MVLLRPITAGLLVGHLSYAIDPSCSRMQRMRPGAESMATTNDDYMGPALRLYGLGAASRFRAGLPTEPERGGREFFYRKESRSGSTDAWGNFARTLDDSFRFSSGGSGARSESLRNVVRFFEEFLGFSDLWSTLRAYDKRVRKPPTRGSFRRQRGQGGLPRTRDWPRCSQGEIAERPQRFRPD